MATNAQNAASHVHRITSGLLPEDVLEQLRPSHEPLPPRVPGASLTSTEAIQRRWALLHGSESARAVLWNGEDLATYAGNIENAIGEVRVPIAIAGPLRVNGSFAHGDYYVPLATTEAALVASYTRGCQLLSEAGGCSALLLSEGVSRVPGFVFSNLVEVGIFVNWLLSQKEIFTQVAESTTSHGKLLDMRLTVEGNHVYVIFEYHTADAAGQNMVTIATQAVCDYIAEHSPVRPRHIFVEANLSGDKKASAQSFQTVRGRKVAAECLLPAAALEKRLHAPASALEEYWRMSALGGVLSGTIGVQGHFANGLAALFLATGQDVACVSEAAVGITRFEAQPDGSLYAAVTLPNVIVGTVGGGTKLPTQSACLEILGLKGTGHARALAEVAAALALAGELSIIGALAAGHFTRAHRKLARND
ncbi:3-hydroxy-3-methylglutaryl-CoA reductase [Spartobacteria bacterium LR76]|nr:3-hydroxy-3-methylglutaryl-CoA reductase [Spartobacteria bacterium LR76]